MKKKGFVLLAAVMLFLSACSGNSGGQDAQTGDGSKTVVIAVMNADGFLQTAVRKFETLHPDIHVEIKEYMALPETNGNGMTGAISIADMEKFVQTVTTQVIAGKGSDLIYMNSLPEDKFVDKGLLVDLNELMDTDSSFVKNKYYENIMKASQNGDGLYAMPFSFALDLIQGNTELMQQAGITFDDKTWTWKQLKEIAKKLQQHTGPDHVAFVNLFSNQLLYDFINSNYSQLVRDGKPRFDSETFRDMMKEIKSMYDEGVLKEEFTYDYEKSLFRMAGLASLEQVAFNKDGFLRKPTVDGESNGVGFQSYFELGMNSKSKVQPEAWAFIKFLLSDEMQASSDLIGLPMNKSIVEAKLEEISVQARDEAVSKSIDSIKELLNGEAERRTSDMTVINIAMEEFAAFMSGQKSAEEVSKLIQNRVTTYLNE
ncbi:ABC transporter substrate-binding protein [Paenibacillus sp. LHD-117]|uniref:ABC transporter substrate-binding protein n=1 Tax=Paenibacillus sp. LHD-117 TaxID=3071412 RepID=UPI0027DF8791|nr:ABC transporter substrate-binding protein [Paenibacillus sp. LHD-117]MDQ6420620.1 ABC transporter substrate-binding protein [Paenibacillus sp. LHD-117]